MEIFFTLTLNLIPLYVIIALGFFAGRFLNADRNTLVNLVLYMFMPIVVFGFVVQLDLKPAYALLPVIIYTIHAIIGLSMLKLGKIVYNDPRANLLSMCTAMGNTGYFGLPLVLLLTKPEWVGVYMFMLLGGVLYEGTIGYYIAARGAFNVTDSLRKLVKFPAIYAISLALIINLSGTQLPDLFFTYWAYFKGAYVISGMMIVGVALSKVDKLMFSWRFNSLVFVGKFAAWPLLALSFIALDQNVLHIFEPEVRKLILVISLVPPAANIAAFASQFGVMPEKAATTVLAGTVFALFFIPLILGIIHI